MRISLVAILALHVILACRPQQTSEILDTSIGNNLDYDAQSNRSAWFVGKHNIIHYCVKASQAFLRESGKSTGELSRLVASTYQYWLDYIEAKEIHGAELDAKFHFPEQLEYMGLCSDPSAEEVVLKLFFGPVEGTVGIDSAGQPVAFMNRYQTSGEKTNAS